MEPTEAMVRIITRCPEAMLEATDAIRAIRAGSPIADRRVGRAIETALKRYGDQFTEQERADLAALLPSPDNGDVRDLDIRIRVNTHEKRQVQRAADAAGQTVSDYLRDRLGLARR